MIELLEEYKRQMQSLMNKVNRVTAYHRHGNVVLLVRQDFKCNSSRPLNISRKCRKELCSSELFYPPHDAVAKRFFARGNA